MRIVKAEKLVGTHNVEQLMALVTEKVLIGDYIEVGAYFSDAAKNLGFKCDTSHSKLNIRLILDPDEYKCIEKLPEFTQVILNNIRQRRDDIIKMVNDDLVFNAYKLTHNDPDKVSNDYHMLDISKIILSTISGSYLRYINNSVNVDKVKHDFEWLIRELEDAGYYAKFFTTPTEVKIQVSLPVKHN